MAEQSQEWSWVAENGKEHAIDESELTFALSSEELPAHTLVHKRGWAEWLPAMQVAELQWALPAGRSDQSRKPELGAKPPAPLDQYPRIKKRARDIARGRIDPISESSLSLPAIKAQRSTDSQPLPSIAELHARHAPFSESEFEEPTLQIDPDALDYAFERLQATAEASVPGTASAPTPAKRSAPNVAPAPAKRSAPNVAPAPAKLSAPNVAPSPARQSSPRAASAPTKQSSPSAAPPPVKPSTPNPPQSAPRPEAARAGSAPKLELSSSWPPATSRPPGPLDSFTPGPPSRPAPERSGTGIDAPTPIASPSAFPPRVMSSPPNADFASLQPSSFPPHAGRATSPSLPPIPRPSAVPNFDFGPLPSVRPPPPNRLPWVFAALLASAVGAAGVYLLGKEPPPEPAPAPVAAPPPPPPKPEPVIPACKVAVSAVPIAGFAHFTVRPIITRAPGSSHLAIGYAQTSKLAVGLVVDAKTLGAEKRFSNFQNSPLLSVSPVTSAMGAQLSFLESRAASTLQSAAFVPAKKPYALGFSRDGLAVRLELEEGDKIIHKPQWGTMSVPSIVELGEGAYAASLRAGGERGNILLLGLNERGELGSEPFSLDAKVHRVGLPTTTVNDGQVMVAFSGVARNTTMHSLYLATAAAPKLPTEAKLVRSTKEPIASPAAARLQNGYLFQYTEGELGKQRVVAQVVDDELRPHGDPLAVSAAGSDAYDGTLGIVDGHYVVVYLVRNGSNNELWATALGCTTPSPAAAGAQGE